MPDVDPLRHLTARQRDLYAQHVAWLLWSQSGMLPLAMHRAAYRDAKAEHRPRADVRHRVGEFDTKLLRVLAYGAANVTEIPEWVMHAGVRAGVYYVSRRWMLGAGGATAMLLVLGALFRTDFVGGRTMDGSNVWMELLGSALVVNLAVMLTRRGVAQIANRVPRIAWPLLAAVFGALASAFTGVDVVVSAQAAGGGAVMLSGVLSGGAKDLQDGGKPSGEVGLIR